MFFTITRLNNENIQQLESSLRGQFENHFDPEEIEQLARDNEFVQRESKLDGYAVIGDPVLCIGAAISNYPVVIVYCSLDQSLCN